MFGRLTFAFIVVSIAAFFCAQSAEAAKGPRITHKVYFDIKQGDENLGRSVYFSVHAVVKLLLNVLCHSHHGSLWWSMYSMEHPIIQSTLMNGVRCLDCS